MSLDQPTTRVATIRDLLQTQDLGRAFGGVVTLSDTSGGVAFTLTRPASTMSLPAPTDLYGNEGADVWWRDSSSSQPENITAGVTDGTSWWAPQWSPDGRYLAMLSTRGATGDGVWLWIWERASKSLRRVSDRCVKLVNPYREPFEWLDADNLLFPAQLACNAVSAGSALAIWQSHATADAHGQATASILDGGVGSDPPAQPQFDLLLVRVADASAVVLASVRGSAAVSFDPSEPRWSVSPDGQFVAYTDQLTVHSPTSTETSWQYTPGAFALRVVDRRGSQALPPDSNVQGVKLNSARWSPSGAALAFAGEGRSPGDRGAIIVANVSRGSVNRLPLAQFALSARTNGRLEWSSDSELLVRGTACEAPPVGCGSREDWWSVPLSGAKPFNLTRGTASIPTELWRTDDGRSWAGLADAQIWRLYPTARRVERLNLPHRVARLVWPVSRCTNWLCPPRTASYSSLIVSVADRDAAAEYELKLADTSLRRIPKPAAGAEFIGYSARSRSTAYYLSDRDGLRLWLTGTMQPLPQLLVNGNQFVRGLEEAVARPIQYTSLAGEALTSWVLFPVGYRAGVKYPLIVWVYPGLVYGAAVPGLLQLGGAFNEFNMQLAAAKGYAVLLPSMPLNPFGSSDDPLLRLRSGVLPALDKVVALGVADPKQLYLLGHSFGGFATNGLVTQTDRFAAAVSVSGFADLLSLYGQFDQSIRYSDAPQEMLTSPGLLEVGQARMGAPPWRDLDRYLRNSPIVHIDAVCTPLLIIDGDLDYVGIQQSEEVFTSLYRQGKRVRFIRYWGEGHVLRAAANIEDMWANIFAWLAEASNRSERPDSQEVCGHSSQTLQ